MSNCPECDREIHSDRCPCGWVAPKVAKPYIPPKPSEFRQKPRGESYRERWYAERNKPYEPPILKDCPPFKCIGGSQKPPRQREPGDDDEDIAA